MRSRTSISFIDSNWRYCFREVPGSRVCNRVSGSAPWRSSELMILRTQPMSGKSMLFRRVPCPPALPRVPARRPARTGPHSRFSPLLAAADMAAQLQRLPVGQPALRDPYSVIAFDRTRILIPDSDARLGVARERRASRARRRAPPRIAPHSQRRSDTRPMCWSIRWEGIATWTSCGSDSPSTSAHGSLPLSASSGFFRSNACVNSQIIEVFGCH